MKRLAPFAVLVILAGHFFYATRSGAPSTASGGWAAVDFDEPQQPALARYVKAGDCWLGLSYGLAGAFGVWCFGHLLQMRRRALAASAGGLTLSGFLWAGVCFFTGCCGSPMLPIYLGLFGPKFLSLTKPLTFGLTSLSIAVGYAWMAKRSP